jgi:putative transposase
LLQQGIQRHGVELIGYCLMSESRSSRCGAPKQGRLSPHLEANTWPIHLLLERGHRSSGHVWQGRYYSCPLDDTHLWEALRYTELNPVRAFLVTSAKDWPWSSAAAHCGSRPIGPWLSFDARERRWSCADWRAYLQATQPESSRKAIRDSTFSGRPLGSAEFTRALERQEHRPLTRQKPEPKSFVCPASPMEYRLDVAGTP